MKKGTVVGGPQANGEAPPKIPRGMLPPTGLGPIEVTRESLDETSSDKPDDKPDASTELAKENRETQWLSNLLPDPVSKALLDELPEQGSPAELVVACEKRLHAANTLLDVMQKRSLTSYFHYAGPAIRLAWSTESWRAVIDPATGKECRSWAAWLRIVKVSRQHAFRMTKEEPLLKALKGLDVKTLGVRQIDALSPVLTSFGTDGVRKLWTAGMGWGDTSATSLLKLRKQLGLEPDKVISEGDPEPDGGSPDVPVLHFQTKPGTFDAARVREVAKAQPEIALLVAREIFAALGIEQSAE